MPIECCFQEERVDTIVMIYKCEICGRESTNIEEIRECENIGIPKPIVSEGDIIYFKDCKDTPLYYEIFNSVLYKSEDFFKVYQQASIFFNQLVPYEVSKIIIDGHNISYRLKGIEGKSKSFYSGSIDFEHGYYYPEIHGNEFMNEILGNYN